MPKGHIHLPEADYNLLVGDNWRDDPTAVAIRTWLHKGRESGRFMENDDGYVNMHMNHPDLTAATLHSDNMNDRYKLTIADGKVIELWYWHGSGWELVHNYA